MDRRPRRHIRAFGAQTTNTLKGSDTPNLRDFFKHEMFAAKRNGSWFRLGRVERSLYGLAMRLDVKLESAMLLRALVGALKKMKEAGDRAYAAIMDGMRLAWAFSSAAVSWGNDAAKGWRNDLDYAWYLGSQTQSLGSSTQGGVQY
ncbi:MAG: hypothetical protein JRM80_00980 [Nitrososphaerota archaeon]|nr:hypothetical protein [Nitrososphaerota archaeon]MDG6960604.1 hypothetical protein [Nitrososphaerota archaeon]MDG7014908.1 hypothetical protein [Nitrososphaerota archaeon]WGO50868.1 MAG: hypothetical protein JRM93_02315 [Nitrososphaerota archaeon]